MGYLVPSIDRLPTSSGPVDGDHVGGGGGVSVDGVGQLRLLLYQRLPRRAGHSLDDSGGYSGMEHA